MTFTIYQASVLVYLRQLKALALLLDKAAAHCAERKIDPNAMLQARLYPDMYNLVGQVQATCNHAARGTARLSGREPMSIESGATFDDLKALVGRTVAFVAAVDAKAMEGAEAREITFPVGDGKRTLSGADYLLGFSMPNFQFHAAMVYAILRHNGLPLNKNDFLGQ